MALNSQQTEHVLQFTMMITTDISYSFSLIYIISHKLEHRTVINPLLKRSSMSLADLGDRLQHCTVAEGYGEVIESCACL